MLHKVEYKCAFLKCLFCLDSYFVWHVDASILFIQVKENIVTGACYMRIPSLTWPPSFDFRYKNVVLSYFSVWILIYIQLLPSEIPKQLS